MITPLEEAPFWKYLEILREEGYEEDADISERFYVDLLTLVENSEGTHYTREQVMGFKFKNLLKASELILERAQQEIQDVPVRGVNIGGKVLAGSGADSLSPQTLRQLSERQALHHEENKIKQVVR